MTRKHLNPLAADLGIEFAAILRMHSVRDMNTAADAFWSVVHTTITGLQRANPNVSRERFVDAIIKEAARSEEARLERVRAA